MSDSNSRIREICKLAPVIPVLVIDDVQLARPLAEALVEGGLPVLEVTLRTPVALQAIAEMSQVEGAVVGAGTLLSKQDVIAAKDHGARFGVSPGSTDELLQTTRDVGMPVLPGAVTASEVMHLLSLGFESLKFFPAEAAGGAALLKSIAGPLPQAQFCPTGGVNLDNVDSYLALPNVMCVGGTWIADAEKVRARDWNGIRDAAAKAAQLGKS